MSLLNPPDSSCVLMAHKELGVDDFLVRQSLDRLRDWYDAQPHLPKGADDRLLKTTLRGCKYSVERAKRTLDVYFSTRTMFPEVLANRDPLAAHILQAQSVLQVLPLPHCTEDGYRVTIVRMVDHEVPHLDAVEATKVALMVMEVRRLEDTSLGDVLIWDLNGHTLGHVARFTPALFKKNDIIFTKAFTTRLSGLHFVNAPNFIDKIITLVKAVMKPKVANRVHAYNKEDGYKGLYKHVPQSLLPVEYGGDLDSCDEIQGRWVQKLLEYRQWFLDQEHMLVDEDKRPANVDSCKMAVIDRYSSQGTFRQLSID